jgi:hypothetical protein
MLIEYRHTRRMTAGVGLPGQVDESPRDSGDEVHVGVSR